ncbi:MAG: hypothetical protein J7496_08590 [Novosphingobium sp.]|nr:hypothetical protein [Novosphingobium sp.]
MSDTVPTIRVKPWGEGQGDFVEINETDFDEKLHTRLTGAELAKLDAPDPLDHDHDGRKGGSLPKDHVHEPADYEVDGLPPPSKRKGRAGK